LASGGTMLYPVTGTRLAVLCCTVFAHGDERCTLHCRVDGTASKAGKEGQPKKRGRVTQTPSGLSAPDMRNSLVASDPALHAAAADPAQAPGSQAALYGRVVYSAESLKAMSLKDLKEVCRSRELVVGGKKQDLVDRILTSQLGPYPSGAAGP